MILCHMTGIRIWSDWKKSFLEIVDKHAPLRKARVRGRGSLWITSELKKQMHEKDILKITAIKSNELVAWAKLKKQRNIVNKAVKQAISSSIMKLVLVIIKVILEKLGK